MGYAIAAELARRGAGVTLVSGPTALDPPPVDVVHVRSAAEMHRAVTGAVRDADALIMAAAVANYTPAVKAPQKIEHASEPLRVELVPTKDILADVAAWRTREGRTTPLLVGFAAETENVIERARAKRHRKGVDAIVANDVSRADAGFEVETNAVTVIGPDGEEQVPLASKAAIAAALVDRLERWLAHATENAAMGESGNE
jgi:phosphopantothenoylcysteine decarboxylase/phosphopantothenate--cysteine ligase